MTFRACLLALVPAFLCSCGDTAQTSLAPTKVEASSPTRPTTSLRATGTVQALQSFSIRSPQITGQSGRMTLTYLIPNGSKVNQDQVIAEFDRTAILDEARETESKLAETGHQLEEKRALIRSDRAKRDAAIYEAKAELQKAQLQLRRGPVISEIDRLKNEARATSSSARLASLEKSGAFRVQAEEASLKVLELKRDRQKLTLERLRRNLDKLVIKSPQPGMVALENIWRSGSMGPPQEGDQMFPGQPVLRLFNPERMIIDASVNESDVAVLKPGVTAKLYVDAYPGAVFQAEMLTASPIAIAGLDSPVRTFSARFRVLSQDPRLLPDLSAALEIDRTTAKP